MGAASCGVVRLSLISLAHIYVTRIVSLCFFVVTALWILRKTKNKMSVRWHKHSATPTTKNYPSSQVQVTKHASTTALPFGRWDVLSLNGYYTTMRARAVRFICVLWPWPTKIRRTTYRCDHLVLRGGGHNLLDEVNVQEGHPRFYPPRAGALVSPRAVELMQRQHLVMFHVRNHHTNTIKSGIAVER